MAKAKKIEGREAVYGAPVLIQEAMPATIELTLTMDEANTLLAIFGAVGGTPDGRRGHCDNMGSALYEVGVRNYLGSSDKSKSGSIILHK